MNDRCIRGTVGFRPVLTKAGDRQHNQCGVDRLQRIVAKPKARHHVRTVIFDHDIGLGNQILDQVYRTGRAKIHTDIAFPRILLMVVTGEPSDVAAPKPGYVAIRRLDLNHICP